MLVDYEKEDEKPVASWWKVPFRQVYAETFAGFLYSCWTCFKATAAYRLSLAMGGSRNVPGQPY